MRTMFRLRKGKRCCVESASVLISLRTWIPPGTAPWAIGDRGLNVSTEVSTRTPRFHQPHLLWEPSSSPKPLSPVVQVDQNGCLFSGEVSGLEAFSPYPR